MKLRQAENWNELIKMSQKIKKYLQFVSLIVREKVTKNKKITLNFTIQILLIILIIK